MPESGKKITVIKREMELEKKPLFQNTVSPAFNFSNRLSEKTEKFLKFFNWFIDASRVQI